MHKLLGVCALALAAAACHQAAPTADVTATQPVSKVAPVIAANNRTPAASSTSSSLTPAARNLLSRYDLTPLLVVAPEAGAPPDASKTLFNGFFGPTHQRIEVVFTAVRRDESQPDLYYVRGKNRYKNIITPFAGTLLLTSVVEQPTSPVPASEARPPAAENAAPEYHAYTAAGRFTLREDSTQRQSGVFRGQVALDWGIDNEGTPRQSTESDLTLTESGGVKFEGTWSQYGTTAAKQVVWVENIFDYGQRQKLLKDFVFGERDPEFNPKYAKLGWNTYWTNDEWWADKPTNTASR